MIHALYATGRNGEMGNADGSLPWRTVDNRIRTDLPEAVQKQCADDMNLFKKLTSGNIVIMGFNTYKTFPKPLPNRINIVIDRNAAETSKELSETEWIFFRTIEDALKACGIFNEKNENSKREVYVIGGAKLLKEAYEKKLISGNTYHNEIDFDFPESSVYFSTGSV